MLRAIGHLVVQLLRVQGDQVGVAEALGIELPARRDQTTDLCLAEAPLGGWQPGELHVLIADPSEAAKHGQRLGVLRLIAVVEGDDDRFARSQRYAMLPVRLHLIERHGVPAGALQRLHLRGELTRHDVQPRERGAPGGGAAITWYIRIGTGSVPGGPTVALVLLVLVVAGLSRTCRVARAAGSVGVARRRSVFHRRMDRPGSPQRSPSRTTPTVTISSAINPAA